MINPIYKRRSIRSYNDTEVSNDTVKKIVKAGFNAPSAMCAREFEFIVIDDKDILVELSKMNPTSFMLSKCNKAIAVIGKEANVYWQQDLSASTQNILLEATNLGVSTCWIGVAPIESLEEYVRDVLNIDISYRVLSIVTLGYTDKEKESNDYYDESKVYYNTFKV